jgi:hypothetical protein
MFVSECVGVDGSQKHTVGRTVLRTPRSEREKWQRL